MAINWNKAAQSAADKDAQAGLATKKGGIDWSAAAQNAGFKDSFSQFNRTSYTAPKVTLPPKLRFTVPKSETLSDKQNRLQALEQQQAGLPIVLKDYDARKNQLSQEIGTLKNDVKSYYGAADPGPLLAQMGTQTKSPYKEYRRNQLQEEINKLQESAKAVNPTAKLNQANPSARAEYQDLNQQIETKQAVLDRLNNVTGTEAIDPWFKAFAGFNKDIVTAMFKNPFLKYSPQLQIAKWAGFDAEDKLKNLVNSNTDYFTQKVNQAKEYSGKGYDAYATIAEGVGGALPQAVLAVMSGGTSAAAALPALGGNAGMATAVQTGLTTLAKNPQFLPTFMQSYGSAYNDAISSGATEEQAQLSAIISGLAVSGIEMAGGIQKLPGDIEKGTESFGKALLKTAMEEGAEEPAQGIVQRSVAKGVYNPSAPLTPKFTWESGAGLGNNLKANYTASANSPDAVLNPLTAAQEFAGGATVGGILGGGQIAVGKAFNAALPTAGTETPSSDATRQLPPGEALKTTFTQTQTGQGSAPATPGTSPFTPVQAEAMPLLPEQSASAAGKGYPIRVDGAEYKVVEIPQSKVDEIAAYIDGLSNADTKKTFKQILKNLFMGQKFRNVNTVANQLSYEIGISSKGIGEIIARQPVNAETLAMLQQINKVVENAKYIASEPSNKNSPDIFRTDIFETATLAGDKPGIAKMRVNVTQDGNKLYYATNKITEDANPQPRDRLSNQLGIEGASSIDTTIPQNVNGVNVQDSTDLSQTASNPALNTKAEEYLARAERTLTSRIARNLSVPKTQAAEFIKPAVRELSMEYITSGSVSPAAVNKVLDSAMAQVSQNMTAAEAQTTRTDAQYELERAVEAFIPELQNVKRYADQTAAERAAKAGDMAFSGKTLTPEEIKTVNSLWKTKKQAEKTADKAVANNLLTDADNALVDRLLRGEITLDDLTANANTRGIKAVYEAKKALKTARAPIARFNNNRRSAMLEQADEDLKGSDQWKDKKTGFQYMRETMERIIRDIVPDKAQADAIIKKYLTIIHQNEAWRTRLKDEFRNRVRAMNLSRKVSRGNKVSEAYAVQYLGEVQDNIDAIEASNGRVEERNGGTLDDWKATKENLFRENPNLDADRINRAIDEFKQMYDELFEMMNAARIRNGYEPVDYRRGYFPHFKADGADGLMATLAKGLGIDMQVTELPTTINGMTHTFRPGIRWFGSTLKRTGFETDFDAVEGFDRYIEGVSDVITHTDDIQRLRALAQQIRLKYSEDNIQKDVKTLRARTDISEEEKQSLIEDKLKKGPTQLSNFVVALEEYTNLLANKKSTLDRNAERLLGRSWAYNLMKNINRRVAANMVAINPASWLTNFIPLTQGGAQIRTDTMLRAMWDTLKSYKASDGFVDRSSFLTNRRGSDPLVKTRTERVTDVASSPMTLIDSFTAGTLVRARYYQNVRNGLGEQTALDEADSWTAGVMADRSKGSMPTLFAAQNPVTKIFTQFQLEVNNQLSYLFKDIPREYKDKSLASLAGVLFKFFVGAFIYNELYEKLIGRRPALDPIGILADYAEDLQNKDMKQANANLFKSTVETLPFIGGVLGGGRVPISSAIPDLVGMAKGELSQKQMNKEWTKPLYYLAPPFGGGQVKKAFEGIKAVSQGGSFTKNSDGEQTMQYPVFNPNPFETAKNYGRAVLFGKSSLPTAQNWVQNDFNTSSAKETAAYQALVKMGADAKLTYDTIQAVSAAQKTADLSETQVKKNVIQASALTADQKATLYYELMADKERKEDVQRLIDSGNLTQQQALKIFNTLETSQATDTVSLARAKKNALASSGLSDAQKADVYYELLASTDDKDTIQEYADVSGLSQAKASEVYTTLALLKPEPGKTQVSVFQKISKIAWYKLTDKQTAALVSTIYTDSAKESLLPYLSNPKSLINMYVKTRDSELVSMTIPAEFSLDKKSYTLTASEKRLFKDAYVRLFNAAVTSSSTAEQIKAVRKDAYNAAKMAVIQSRN